MMRCGFCDCFGPFRSPFSKDDLDEPLDENSLNRCLELLRAHEQRTAIKKKKNGKGGKLSKDDLDEPLDENSLNRCLELLKAYEQQTAIKV
ncbi:unnamed protein product [Enterobius vermicularis]|uniref:Uncharacterized protein n=1 Tax=Enterobius vermicularis TaxID=51028 RepID=A0A0N4VFE1_ENTVE|nr:unnamed protein product [Enterobius vermicularis]